MNVGEGSKGVTSSQVALGKYKGLNCDPQRYVQVLTPAFVNRTLFRNRVFADTVELRI